MLAVIDLGTNTFHLLVARQGEKGYEIIDRERIAVKLGLGGINQNIITEEGEQRALVALQRFKNIIDQWGVGTVHAFGTSAFRNASNAEELVRKINAITHIEVNIISGDREAEYIYWGSLAAIHWGDEPALIMDIGGGSVEFIIGSTHKILWKKSIEIGAQRLLEKFHQTDPLPTAQKELLYTYLDRNLEPLREALQEFCPRILIGSSGTFDTLSEIFCRQHGLPTEVEETEIPLTQDAFYNIFHDLLLKNRSERMQIPGMIEMRVDMIVVACCLIDYVLSQGSFSQVRVSTYSLKEGVLNWLSHRKIHNAEL